MNQFLEFIPILLFFIAFKLYDIYIATGVAMVATIIQVAFTWYRYRKVETMQWITLGLIVVMGGATIVFHDEQFIKWKLSIIEWLFGAVFFGSQFIGKRPFVERMMSKSLTLPSVVWRRLNMMWGAFFTSIGFINLYVMFHYDTAQWVTFKTFGVPGLMIVFILLQMIFLYKYIDQPEK